MAESNGPRGEPRFDDLTVRLRRLGSQAELAAKPTSAEGILRKAEPHDVEVSATQTTGELQHQRRPSLVLGLAAATILVVALVGIAFANRNTAEAPMATAVLGQLDGEQVPDDGGWSELRACESNDDYAADTGNTFYGAYQFTSDAWRTVGGSGNPADAPALEQDLRAAALHQERGEEPWPVCKVHLSGPMPNPLTPAWEQAWHQPHDLIVFLQPDAVGAATTTVSAAIDAAWRGPVLTIDVVSKQEALEDFQKLFADDPDIATSVEVDDMPASLRVTLPDLGRLDTNAIDDLRGRADVLQVIVAPQRGPLHVTIPALDIVDEPILDDWRLDDLRRGVAAIATAGWEADDRTGPRFDIDEGIEPRSTSDRALPTSGMLVLASASSPWRLGDLVAGDAVIVDRSVDPTRGLTSLATVEVLGGARSVAVDELAVDALPARFGGDLILVAPDPDDPARRLVVATRPAPPLS